MNEANNILALLGGASAGAGAALAIALGAIRRTMITRRMKDKGARIAGRGAVRLGLRLARFGQPTLLVEAAGIVRVARADDMGRGELQYVGALGNLILARRR
jgi:hypothetical protein